MAYTIVVLIKQVPDVSAIRIDRASGKPILGGQLAISSFDDYAIEAAIQLKETHGGEVIAVAAGPASVKDAIQRALGMGADRGLIVPLDNVNDLDTLAVAELLADQIRPLGPDVILCGQNSDDVGTGHVGPQVAERLGLPQVSSVTRIEANDNHFTLHRDTEEGKQVVDVSIPVLLMAMTGLNTPRYPSLKGIMAAKKKPVDQAVVDAPAASSRLTWSEPIVPPRGASGTILQDLPPVDAAKQLVAWLTSQKLI